MDELGGPPLGFSVELSPREVDTWFRCEDCHVVRVVVVSLTSGAITYSKYMNYPAGYKWNGADAAPSKADRRIGYLREREARRNPGSVSPLRRSS